MSPIPSGPFVLQLKNDEAISSEEQFQRFVNFMTNEFEETIPNMKMIHQHNEEIDVDILCNMAVFDEPLTVDEALSLPDAHKWQEAMNEEEVWCYDGTWTVVDKAPNMSLLTSKWVFKRKRDQCGIINRYRARLVVRGFSQIPGEDYGNIFAPVVRYTTIRMLLALCAHYGLYKTHLDAPKAFTQADLDTPLYMKPPPGIKLPKGKVFKLHKSLYGLKQAAQRWWTVLSEFIKTIGFIQCVADPCLFYLVTSSKEFAIISTYVDDILLCTTSEQLKIDIVKKLFEKFKITDEGDFTWSLGMHVQTSEDRHTITIDMERYTKNIIKKFAFDKYPVQNIPMDPSIKFASSDCPTNENEIQNMMEKPYRQALGCLMFLMVTFRMDISFPTISLSRFSNNPSIKMWKALKRIYQYLKGTSDIKLTYSKMNDEKNPTMIAFTDADWSSNDLDHRRAVIGYIVFMSGAAISWTSKFNQPALSSCESEYHGMGQVSTEVVAHSHLINEIEPLQWKINSEIYQSPEYDTITVFTDNSSSRQTAMQPNLYKRMKHTHIRYHVIRNFVKWLIIRFQLIPGPDDCADMMVKANSKAMLRKHRATAFGPYLYPEIIFSPEEMLRQSIYNRSQQDEIMKQQQQQEEEEEEEGKSGKNEKV